MDQLASKKEKTERAGKKGSTGTEEGTLQNNHWPTCDLYWLNGLKKKKFKLFWFIDFCANKHSPLAKKASAKVMYTLFLFSASTSLRSKFPFQVGLITASKSFPTVANK